ncbi:MAG: LytR/AlgR family response regulator transcription factor [Candidatus Cyclobacteriaceae bacterium M3_2C_046]
MKVLILEDEELARERLVEQIKKYDPDIDIVDQFDTVQDTIEFFQSGGKVDLAFFDIRLSDGISFEVFEKMELNQPIIFTTAYDKYALDAFKVNSIDYLLKPINYSELKQAIDKFKKLNGQAFDQYSITKDALHNILNTFNRSFKKRFLVKYGDHIQFKPVEEIAYFYADGKIVYLVISGNQRKYIIDHTLEDLENNLLNPEKFFRINRKFIISIDAISDIKSYVNSRLKLKLATPCDQDLIVSREKVNAFKDWLSF